MSGAVAAVVCANVTTAAAQNSSAALRENFALQYQRGGAMMGTACDKVVIYGSGSDSFALKCPGL